MTDIQKGNESVEFRKALGEFASRTLAHVAAAGIVGVIALGAAMVFKHSAEKREAPALTGGCGPVEKFPPLNSQATREAVFGYTTP